MAAEKKKNRRRVEEVEGKPTKEEYAVAKFLRFNVPTREGKFHNMEVQCFFASAAVDALMESKWSAVKNPKEPLFINRNACINYCQRLLQKGLFHRAEKVQRKKDKDKDKGDKTRKKKGRDSEKDEAGTGDELRERKSKKKGKKEKEDSEKEQAPEKEAEEKKEEKKDDGKKKKEKRLKLVMTDDQRFIDGEENIYVWIYDPVHAKTLIIGSLIVLGAIALCLFPLWPEEVRIGVYYLSLAAAGFVGFILSLVVIRLILFCLIWILTLGKHHFWLLPNLTEDVGFFESFRPLYKHDMVTSESKDKDKKSSKKSEKERSREKEKAKSSDQEESGSEGQEEFEMIDPGDVNGEEEEEAEGGGPQEEEGGGDQEEGSEEGGEADYEEDDNGMDEEDDEYDEEEDQNGEVEEEDEDQNEGEEEEEDSEAAPTEKEKKDN